ncbi:MAG: ROK family transcriptional regulator [Oscillospiraceae bacterium]|nr:ROK family transcriptional regulator [Oscillospiraceae bacterium]
MQFEQGANPSRVKAANQAAILKTIYHCAPIKRSEIAQRLGLTLPTITTNINSMMARGIVRETGSAQQDGQMIGRKAHPVDIVPESRHFIGIELQGTRRTACLLDYRGTALASMEDGEDCQDYQRNIELSCALMRKVLSACKLRLEQVSGIGVCTPGLVDTERGVLEIRPSYNWTHKDVRGDIAALSGYEGPVWVENNACARAYGAQLFQREVLGDAQTFAYLFINQGIACPLVLNTATLFGSVVGAGEVGHMVMVPGGLRCSCGNHGCLEAYSSDRAVLDRCAGLLEEGRAPLLRAQCGGAAPTMDHVLAALEQGDGDVAEIVERAVHILGIGVANINNFACPSKMLIEGKLFCRQENRDRLLAVVRENLCGVIRSGTEFIFVEPEACSGAMGAAAMAICKDLETYVET